MKSAVVIAAAALGIALGASASQASTPPPIVFAANRAPTVTGEIYRVDPNGRRVDLSRSAAQDTAPVVSSDGKRVAFISDRGGEAGVYQVGIDGRGLAAIARRGPWIDQNNSSVAWQPNGAQVAVDTGNAVSILQRSYKPINFPKSRFGASQPWSPDGQVLLLSQFQGLHTLRAVSPQGLTLWTGTENVHPVGGWSSQGLVAVSAGRGVAVYDEVGHVRFKVRGWADAIAWSQDGTRLAVEWGVDHRNLEVLSNAGARLLEERVPVGNLGWIGDRRVVIGDAYCTTCKTVGVDVRTGKTSPASGRWLAPRSADGKLAVVTSPKAPGFDLGVAPVPRGAPRTYRNVPGCLSDGDSTPAVSYLQFAGRSILYQSWGPCDPPLDNLYAVRGTRIHRLTYVQAQETQPVLSPDGSEIAYVWAYGFGQSCGGCSDGIRVASASGAPLRTLTNPGDCVFDDSPSWSPDGMTILYWESSCANPGELFTIPAAGGTPHDLGVAGAYPAWGPTRIAYVNGGVWTANPDGSNPTLVSPHGQSPAWSVTGQLAYLVGKNVVIGSKIIQLPFTGVGSLRWTPDGTRLLVTATTANKSGGPGPFDLFTLKPDGTGLKRLTKNYGVS